MAAHEECQSAPDYEAIARHPVSIEIFNRRIEPHIAGVWTRQTLVLKNLDGVGVNPKLDCFNNPVVNPLVPAKASSEHRFTKPETLPVTVSDNIVPWMRGHVLVRPDPYFAISAADGSFKIKNVPVGEELEFQAWHEVYGYLKHFKSEKVATNERGRFRLTLEPGENRLGTFKIAPRPDPDLE